MWIGVVGVTATIQVVTGLPAAGASDGPEVSFSSPVVRCTITDPVLTGLSGITDTPQGLMAVADNEPGIFLIAPDCSVTQYAEFPKDLEVLDVEDVSSTPEGTLWIGDIGGNRKPRRSVQLSRWVTGGSEPTTTVLAYPKGTHDSEALLIDIREVPIIVTKDAKGKSLVFTPGRRIGMLGAADLREAGKLDVASWPLSDVKVPGSLLISGGAVSPSGTHAALRTYTAIYEWDVPDGDVAAALASRPPDRAVRIPKEKQGEAITYSADGSAFLTGSEQVPSSINSMTITRTTVPALASPEAPRFRWAAGAALAIVLLAASVLALARRRARWH